MSPTRKLDLLADCNEQRIPPKQFQETFCNRCRNAECVNARWAVSRWEERMGSQFERLLLHPERADPREERWRPIVTQAFVESTTPEVWNRAAASTARSDAVAEAWGGGHPAETPPRAVEGAPPAPAGTSADSPPTAEEPNPGAGPRGFQEGPRVDPAPNAAPRGFANTAFPAGGVMIDEGVGTSPSPSIPRPAHDPWSIRPRPSNVVERGARVRMGK